MSSTVNSATQHFVVASGIARDQAESLARGNARPDDGFWRDVFEQAGGQAGMAGSGVAIPEGAPDATQAFRQPLDPSSQGGAPRPTPADAGDAASAGQRERGATFDAAQTRTLQATATGLVALPHRTVVPGSPAELQSGADRGQAGDAPGDAPPGTQARPAGGAPHASARLPAPVVVTVAAASSDEWRVYLRGQGLTPARALALASQAASGMGDGAEGAPMRHVASVALNGQTIYSTSGQRGDETPGPSVFSLTA